MGISNKGKIIILAAWTLLLSIIVILVGVFTKPRLAADEYSSYNGNSYDEYIMLDSSIVEDRYSSNYDKNMSAGGESIERDLSLRIMRKDATTTDETIDSIKRGITGYRCYLTIITKNGEKILKEKSSTSTIISEDSSSYKYTMTFSKFAEVKMSTNSDDVVNQTPDKIYVWFIYDYKETISYKDESVAASTNTGSKEIKYTIDFIDMTKVSKPSQTLSSPKNMTSGTLDPIKVSVSKTLKNESGSLDKYDYVTTSIVVNKNNFTEDELKSVQIEVVGVVKNDKNDAKNEVPDYVLLTSYYGSALVKAIPFGSSYARIDAKYELSEVYVFIRTTGSENTFIGSYSCPLE